MNETGVVGDLPRAAWWANLDDCQKAAQNYCDVLGLACRPVALGIMTISDAEVLLAETEAHHQEYGETDTGDAVERLRASLSGDVEYWQGRSGEHQSKLRRMNGRLADALAVWLEANGEESASERVAEAGTDEILEAVLAVLEGEESSDVAGHLPQKTYRVRMSLRVSATYEVAAASAEEAREEAEEQIEHVTACGGGFSFSLDEVQVDEVE